ncbi:MAG: GGDEF domain-containing protein, partial [Gammaproteobacteria bacterium]|nr:GGDEF domain-containing protein [Gammaproteobacteria bacterium]
IDRLKDFNQQYGHLAGDHVIYAVADTLRDHFRSTDLIARSAGDEFAILLPETDLNTALKVAERTRQSVEQYNELNREDALAITVSVGVAELGAENQLAQLLDRANAALQDAKRQGNHCVKAA